MMTLIDNQLNKITMYRLVLYYVAGLLVIAFGLGFFGLVPNNPMTLAFTTAFITFVCWATNQLFARVMRVPVNTESIWITAFILALIMPSVSFDDTLGLEGLALASFVAIASKFVLAIGRKHVFNPVAIGVVASAMLIDQPATWWVGGNLEMLPFVLIGGLLVVRKMQRFDMISSFILANLATTLLTTDAETYSGALQETVLYTPLFFAAFAMLTEPLTAPADKVWRMVYGAIIGVLACANITYGDYYFTPELAFLVGNVFAFIVSPKGRFKLTLLRVEKMANGCFDFVFKPDRPLSFKAGQYVDWTLGVRNADDRGNRRPFTIASAPSETEVRLGVKFYSEPSAFKRSLAVLKPGAFIYASHVAGSFVLPKSRDEKMVFIAGGIGITPFRSMVQELINKGDPRELVLLYGNNKADEIAYTDVFDRAEREIGMKTVYAVNNAEGADTNMHRGFIDAALITREVPDFRERTFYISGPRGMVVKFQSVLKELGVAHSKIKVDFFPGFA